MPDVIERIAEWQRTGLIDAETADRLRATIDVAPEAGDRATPGTVASATTAPPAMAAVAAPMTSAGGSFGPVVQVAEAFAYLGVGFLASAWTAFIASTTAGGSDPGTTIAAGAIVSALAFTAGFVILRQGDDRRRRAAGVTAWMATAYVAVAVASLAAIAVPRDATLILVLTSLAATTSAALFRLALPALVPQLALLLSATGLAGAILTLLRDAIFGASSFDQPVTASDGLLQVVLEGVWWTAIAVTFGVLALREADDRDDPAAQRRAGMTRLWAGLVIVLGVASAVMRSGPLPGGEFEYGRFLEPWIGDLILIAIAAGLVGRAFRRQSTAFLVTGALSLLIALTDFNAAYLTDTLQMGLLVEGVILLGIGFAAHRLRSMLDRSRGSETFPAAAAPAVPSGDEGAATPPDGPGPAV